MHWPDERTGNFLEESRVECHWILENVVGSDEK